MDIYLDLNARGGRRAALEHALRDSIRAGRMSAGARLPSSRALADELGVSRGTVTAAYDQLTAEGYLLAKVGSGTVVTDVPRDPAPTIPDGRVTEPRTTFDLRPGSPDVMTFPTSAWLRCTRRALNTAPAKAFGHGDPAGTNELRLALSHYLRRARGVLAGPSQIVITTGYVQALALLAGVLGTGKSIAMENPGLPFHRDVVRRAGAYVAALPVDTHGAQTERLAAMDMAAAVLTPAHQYPLGMTLHPQRRHAAAEWARTSDGLIIEDDYDGEFRYDRQPVGAMQGLAPEHVVYVGTASKTLAPAVRLGWMVLPERLVDPVVDAKRHADLHSDTITQLAFTEMINSHAYDRHVRSVRLGYRKRRDLLLDSLAPLHHTSVGGVAAGLHALVQLPRHKHDEETVVTRAAERGLAVTCLGHHWHQPGDHPAGLVVGYATPSEGSYAAAIDTLVTVLSSLDDS